MGKIKRFITSPLGTLGAFALAVGLLLLSTVGGAQAALTYYSDYYKSQVGMDDIGVSLMENGERISWRDYNSAADGTWDEHTGVLLGNMLGEGEKFKLGAKYKEELSVRNSGTINQYVRVSIYKYWAKKDGDKLVKLRNLSPDTIRLNLVNTGTDWLVDEGASTQERTVLYYSKPLYSKESTQGSDTSPLFADSLLVDDSIARKVTQETSTETIEGTTYTTITTKYDYDGTQFCVEAVVDAVQEHNAQDAILSAWGRKVNIASDGTLSLVQ